MKIILVMGLPGAGKTTLANELAPALNAKRLNADEVRKAAKDWEEVGVFKDMNTAKKSAEQFVKLMGEDIDELNRLNSSEAERGANDHQADKKAGTTGLARKSPYCCPNSQVI